MIKKLLLDLYNGPKSTTGEYSLSDVYADTDSIAANIWPDALRYTDAIRTQILADLASHPVSVLLEYPYLHTALPCVVIQRKNDGMSQRQPIGDFFESDYDVDDDGVVESDYETTLHGVFMTQVASVEIWAHGTNQRDDIYRAIRWLTIRGRDLFNLGIAPLMSITQGRDDEVYQPGRKPEKIYLASFQVSCEIAETWTERDERTNPKRVREYPYSGNDGINVPKGFPQPFKNER